MVYEMVYQSIVYSMVNAIPTVLSSPVSHFAFVSAAADTTTFYVDHTNTKLHCNKYISNISTFYKCKAHLPTLLLSPTVTYSKCISHIRNSIRNTNTRVPTPITAQSSVGPACNQCPITRTGPEPTGKDKIHIQLA